MKEKICKQCGIKLLNNSRSHHPLLDFCCNKCKFNFRNGKTLNELYGIEKANKIKNKWLIGHKLSEESKRKIGKFFKGKTYEQIMGKEKAKEMKLKRSQIFLGKGNPFYNKRHPKKMKEHLSLLKLGKSHEEIMGKENADIWHKKMSGKNHSNYKGGYSIKDYKNFTERFKNLIRKRDNQICMLCGKHREKMNTTLSIHHIDYDKHNSSPENCISLCFECHAKTNYNTETWIKLFQDKLSKCYNYDYLNKRGVIIDFV